VAILVKVKIGSPILFSQIRPGKKSGDGNEILFKLYKFRTMTNARNQNGELLPDRLRLVKFGAKLREWSLDELPEVWNILKGDMSIIGPRPQLVRDMVFMTNDQRNRHNVRPGLSGLAQIRGRNEITWEEKLNLDLEYIKHITFVGDVKILIMTLLKVFKREGITERGIATSQDLGDYLLTTKKIDKKTYIEKQNESYKIFESNRKNVRV